MVQIEPLQNVTQSTFWKISVHDPAQYFNRDLVVSIHRVEMRWRMFARKYTDDDPQESRQFRHNNIGISTVLFLRQHNVEVTGAGRLYRTASGGPQGYVSCGQVVLPFV